MVERIKITDVEDNMLLACFTSNKGHYHDVIFILNKLRAILIHIFSVLNKGIYLVPSPRNSPRETIL